MTKWKTYIVDGRETTVPEMAAELHITVKSLQNVMYRECDGSLPVAVYLIREGLALNGRGNVFREMVDGRWTTLRQAAGMLGVSVNALRLYRRNHGGTLADIVPTLIELMGMEQPPEMNSR